MFKDVLKKYRKLCNITQSQLGQMLNYSQDTISLWEKGKAFPDYNAIKQLAVLFNISADVLLEIETSEQRKNITINNSFNNNTGNINF